MRSVLPLDIAPGALRSIALVVALVLAGCAGVKPPPRPQEPVRTDPPVPAPAPPAPAPAPAPAPSAADQRAAAPAALAAERKSLQSLFAGTPVRITQTRDGPVGVEVPREFCFDPGQSEIKPPLASVLDKLAQSMRRAPLARLTLVSAPDDTGAAPSSTLAQQRAAQLQKHLQSRGVAASRIGRPTPT
ncbi:MAG TPA: OmpA family protein, partial [Rubrivivax sp.]|nr:OmpA family protein [Rubrivivax sp.]